MKKRIAIIAAVALTVAAAGNLAAQGFWTTGSPTANKSGRFTSPADDFIFMTDWKGVEMEKWFGFASWASNAAVLGWAQKFGDLYVALGYSGTAWGNLPNPTVTEGDYDVWTAGTPATFKSWKSYGTNLPTLNSTGPDNNIGVLIGVADMGFRLFFSSTHQSFKDQDFIVGSGGQGTTAFSGTVYNSYTQALGDITPQIGWGMAEPLTDNGVCPWLTLDLGFHREYTRFEIAQTSSSSDGEQITDSQNYFAPTLTIGLGGFTFYKQDSFDAAFDLEYSGTLYLYDNEYSYQKSGSSKYETGKIKGKFTSTGLTEDFDMENKIAPMLKLGWKSEDGRLALKSRLKLEFDLNPSIETVMGTNAKWELEKSGTETKTFDFNFIPAINLAAQYQIIPDKLSISIGGEIKVGKLNIKTEEKEEYLADKAQDHTKTKTTSTGFTGTSTGLGAAVTWNLTKNVWLEGSTGININNGVSNVYLIGNVIQFSSILAGLKF